MRKRSRITLALLLLAVVGGVMWLILRPSEPMYKGKPLSVWLEVYGGRFINPSPNSQAKHDEAIEALRSIGTNAIPTLLRRLRAKDSPLKAQLVELAQKQHIFKVKYRPAWILQQEGFDGFMVLGADGEDAVPELIKMYEHGDVPDYQRTIPILLANIGPGAEQAVPMLVRVLGDTGLSPESRSLALGALGQIHARPEVTVPALVKCLTDRHSGLCWSACYAIGNFGSAAKMAVPDLLKALAGADEDLKKAAGKALREIDPDAAAKAGVE